MKKDLVNIKGTIHGLVICVEPDTTLEEISLELEAKVKARPGFFKNAKFKIHSHGALDPEITEQLTKICIDYGMNFCPDILWPYADTSKKPHSTPPANDRVVQLENAAVTETAAATDWSDGEQSRSVSLNETLLIQKNLRSGQRLHYNGNLVIMGDVNPGAEVSAGGDIVVMGSLRGIAHAGAYGNEKAIILAYRLAPTQLRIADRVTRPPEKDDSLNLPELARLSQGQMFIEPYRSQKNTLDS